MLMIFARPSLCLGMIAAAVALAQPSPVQAAALPAELDSFFRRVGFEDYRGRIKDSLDKGRALSDIGIDTLKNNLRRYAMVNEARELAVIMLVDAYPRLRDPDFRKKFLAFSVTFLTLKPIAPPLALPEGIKAAGPAAVDAYLAGAARRNMRRQAAALISEYAGDFAAKDGIFARKKSRLSDLMARYVMRVYLDPQIGNTQWLGRALILGLVRYSALYDKSLHHELENEVQKNGFFMENFVGSTLVLSGKDGPRRVKVETGDLIFERSRDTKESAAITAAALPQDERTASLLGLLGSLIDAYWDVSPEARANGLTRFQRRKMMTAQEQRFSKGMSHVAQLAVYRDDRTGIGQTLIWDDYPYSVHLNIDKDEEWGGIRINGFEHFANPADVMRVGIATVNKEKLYRIAKENLALKKAEIQERGWKKYAWESYIPKVNENREILPQAKPVKRYWEFQISQADFIKLHGVADQGKWLKAYQNRLIRGWKTMLTDWGVWFYWIDAGAGLDDRGEYQAGRYWFGGMYCSQAVHSASFLFTGLNLEIRPSHYAGFLVWAQRLGLKEAKQLDLKVPVIAPSSFAVQPYSNPMIQVIYPPYSLKALAQFGFQIQTASADAKDGGAISADLFNGSWNKGEEEALVARERKFIEYVDLDGGMTMEQIFGKGRGTGKEDHAPVVPVR